MENERKSFYFGRPAGCRKIHGAKNFPPSQTIQDDALTLREILVRFSNGQPLPSVAKQPYYPSQEPSINDEVIIGKDFDLAERDIIKSRTKGTISRLQQELQGLQEESGNVQQPIKIKENETEKETNQEIGK